MKHWFRREIVSAPALARDQPRIVPQLQTVTLQLPFCAVVWSRPVGIVVETRGETRRIPITDVTRLVQLVLSATAVAAWLVIGRISTNGGRNRA